MLNCITLAAFFHVIFSVKFFENFEAIILNNMLLADETGARLNTSHLT